MLRKRWFGGRSFDWIVVSSWTGNEVASGFDTKREARKALLRIERARGY